MNARCSGCGLSAFPNPSMVVTSLPSSDHSGVSQAVTARSPTITLQAPHSPAPQPKCEPVMPSRPRRRASSEESGSASMSVSTPLRRNRMFGMKTGTLALRLVGECLDDFSPFHNIVTQVFIELLRRHRHRRRALIGPELDDLRPLDGGVDGGIQPVDDGLWCPGWRHQSEPDGGFISGEAGVFGGRYLGQHARAPLSGRGERPNLALTDIGSHR